MFDNIVFDSWLTKKSDEILSKVDRERISTEEMIILLLKAQTNHFHHMDDEFRGEFGRIHREFREVDKRFEQMQKQFDKRFEQVDKKFDLIDKRFEQVDKRFEQVDKKFDKQLEYMNERFSAVDRRMEEGFATQRKFFMWGSAVFASLLSGLYLKMLF